MVKNKKYVKEDLEELDEEETLEEDNYEVTYESKEEFNLVNEVKGLKILTCISICITIISLLLSLVILSKVSNGSNTSTNNTGSDSSTDTGTSEEVEYDTSMFTEISVDDFMEMYKENKTYFVYTGRSSCGYCVAFLPFLQQSVSEYDYTLYYLDVDKLSNDDLTEIAELHDDFASTIGGTPMVYVIKNKDVVDINKGYTEYDTYASFLEDNGIKTRK